MHNLSLLRSTRFMAIALSAACLLAGVGHAAAAGTPFAGQPGVVDQSAVVNFQDLAQKEALAPQAPPAPVAVHRPLPGPRNLPLPADALPPKQVAGVKAAAPTTAAAPTFTGFQALVDNNTTIPPDTMGAVGPNHVMTTLNSQVRIQDRSGNVISTVSLASFWGSLGHTDVFDPHIRYDAAAGRWVFVVSADGGVATSSILVGASQTSDPTGTWHLYAVKADAAGLNWADYPALGINANWVVVTVNMFSNAANAFQNAKVYAFNKAQLYAGTTPAFSSWTDTSGGFTLQPAVSQDPAATTLYLVDSWNGNSGGSGVLRISTITGTVGSEVLTLGTLFPSVNAPWGFGATADFAPQLGSANKIDAGDDRILNCYQRNGFLWCTQTAFLPASASTRSAAQWWQLDPVAGVVQFGRVDDPTGVTFYAYPSIAVNKNNDVLLGYSSFSASQYASANFSFRSGTDPANTLQAGTLFKAGEAPYYKTFGGTSNRWGDFSSTVVDPADDVTLWTIQEYASTPANGFDRWATWWAKVTPPTGTNPQPVILVNGSSVPITIPSTTPVSLTISLNPGGNAGQNADWWVVAATPFGTFSYVYPTGWVTGIVTTVQVPLFNLTPPFQVLNAPLPVGAYTVYFGVDLTPDKVLDNPLYYNSVQFTVQ